MLHSGMPTGRGVRPMHGRPRFTWFLMVRIAIFLSNLEVGAAERVLVTLANEFIALGHQVEFVLKEASGELSSRIAMFTL